MMEGKALLEYHKIGSSTAQYNQEGSKSKKNLEIKFKATNLI